MVDDFLTQNEPNNQSNLIMKIRTKSNYAVGIVAGIHMGLAVAEMFLWKYWFWTKFPVLGFHDSIEADKVTPIVANAGLYNAFIAAGLVWSIVAGSGFSRSLKWFFLCCVAIAGVVGVSLKWTTLVAQTLPAFVAMLILRNEGKSAAPGSSAVR